MRALPLLLTAILLTACSGDSSHTSSSSDAAPANTGNETAASEATAAQTDTASGDTGINNRGSEAAGGDNWWDELPRADWANYKQVKTYNPWFEVYEIQKGIFAIYEPGQFEEVISWLIVGNRQALLFDTGLGMGDIRAVVKQLTKQPLLVLNSHSHYDHIGGNYQFDIIMARNHPFTKERAKGTAPEELALFASKDWIWKQHPPSFDANNYQTKPYGFTHWIEEGQFVDLGGVSLEIIYSPGHAPDGIVLIDHQRRLMFMGDTFYPGPLYAHLEGSDVQAYAASAAKLAAMVDTVDYLLPSHNVPLADSSFLIKLDEALQAILLETAPYETNEEGREYTFEGFGVLTPDPPVASTDMDLL